MNPVALAPILTTLAGLMMPIQPQLQQTLPDFQLAAGGVGFDSMAVLPNGKLYATYGSKYVRISLPEMKTDPGYPKPIRGNWGALPESFNQGFDSMSVLSNGALYVTKGPYYVKYSDPQATNIAQGYPKLIRGNWGALPENFNQGFDSMSLLPNGILYVTKGNAYVRYTDGLGSAIAEGYPKRIRGNWGALPESFNQGFDAMESLKNGMTYVTRGSMYLRYRDRAATIIDDGYPKALN